MRFLYFSHNGTVKSVSEAVIPLSNISYAYGFGVYETIRVTKGIVYFLEDHLERLLYSAEILELEQPFGRESLRQWVLELIAKNNVDTGNVKILLIGGNTKEDAQVFILCLNPLFPDRKLYKEGAQVITVQQERILPHAKSLNMLPSYLAYRKAKRVGAYDALLVSRKGTVVEGTRTNFFCIKDKILVSPPADEILLGVTRKAVLTVAMDNGYMVEEKEILLEDVFSYDGAFITSTSSKIVPIASIDGKGLPQIPSSLYDLIRLFDSFLTSCNGKLT
jgi:branched-chain amino acid aminotransferase